MHVEMSMGDIWGIPVRAAVTFLRMSVCGPEHPFLLGRYLGVELLGQLVNVCLTVAETATQSFKDGALFSEGYSPLPPGPSLDS